MEVVFGKHFSTKYFYGIFIFTFIFPRTVATASRYPHVEVIGTDLAPAIINDNNIPMNCRFELDDVNRGLAHFYDQMDLVHMRAVGAGVSPCRFLPIHQAPFHPLYSGGRDYPRAYQVPEARGYAPPG